MYGPVEQINARKASQDLSLAKCLSPKALMSPSIWTRFIVILIYLWEEPERFDPERFADKGGSKTHEGLAWIPFSNGSRQCIGMNFSIAEQRAALYDLAKYNITLPADSIHRNELRIGRTNTQAPQDLTAYFERRY